MITTLSIDDADHFRIAEIQKFHRTSTRQIQDVSCEEGNPHHIEGEDAFLRSNAFFELKDLVTSICWLRIGAIQGNAVAQGAYAFALLHGRGVAENIAEARIWAQKSADQHDPYGELNLAAIYSMQGFAMGMGKAEELMKRYRQHDPDMAYFGDPTPQGLPVVPVFIKDQTFAYDLAGEWRLIFPANSPRHPLVTVVVLLKDGNFQMIAGNPNVLYPMGESMFNGRYVDGRINGDLMDAPAHSGGGYRGYAWTKAEIQIADADNLILPGGIKMKRTSGELGANKACDAVKYAGLDASYAFNYADKDYELKNYGNAACWLYVSASQGNSEARLSLGLLLHFGTGVRKDYQQSFIWFRKAADANNLDAERAVAHCYQFGIGIQKSPELAKSWTDRVNGQVKEIRKAAIEEQKQRRNLALWGAILSGFKSGHELKVDEYQGRGMSRSRAEDAARSDEADEEFFNSLINGYHPPPMPPPH
jgi:TPR repeat protein